MASLAQMVLILGSAAALFTLAWHRWQHPRMPRVDWGAATLATAMLVNSVVSRRLRRVALDTGSQALEAEATHLWSDMVSCGGVLLGLVLVGLTHQPRLDPLIAAVMTVVVVASAVRLLRDTLRPLLDESLPVDEQAIVEGVLDSDGRVLGYHRLRTRKSGAHRMVDVHIQLDDQLSFAEAHAVSEEVEDAVRDALPYANVIVHAEPFEAEMEHQQTRHGGSTAVDGPEAR